MKSFDFDKFSKSAWLGSRHNSGWQKYPDVITTDDSAKGILAEHKFNAPPSGDERCLCGWSGDSWGDHVREVLTPEPVQATGAPETVRKPRKKAPEKASEAAEDAE